MSSDVFATTAAAYYLRLSEKPSAVKIMHPTNPKIQIRNCRSPIKIERFPYGEFMPTSNTTNDIAASRAIIIRAGRLFSRERSIGLVKYP
jgi:hypothetical protein